MVGYSDSNYVRDLDDYKSTSGYVFMLASRVFAYFSRKQPMVTLSTTKEKFMAATAYASQATWMRRVLEKLSLEQSKCSTTILYDNISTIKLSRNHMLHGRSKNIDVHFYFLHDLT